ncbi:otogelin-like [Heterodontus francisci]|uniref:otogelin-like n=1 Tax=Heterodontus francisci TaxID=7792 RepID=UPI00355BA4F6
MVYEQCFYTKNKKCWNHSAVPSRGNNRDLICRTWGQYNYETFDGLYYYYPGNCTYTLVRECEQSQQSLSIQVHNDPACQSSPYSCWRSVSLFFAHEGEISLQGHEVIHHGQSVQLPYIIGNLKFEQIAGHILVRHHHGFSLAWDGSSGVNIKMNVDYVGKTCGLCGNFNGNMHDDLYTSYGVLTEEIAIFGNSWMEDIPDKKPCHVTPINYPAPCSGQSQRVNEKIRNMCTVLLGYPFILCHYYVQPYLYMASCVNDLCMYGPDNATLCGVLTEYARACAHANRPLHEWRQLFNQCVAICEGEFVHRECVDCCPVSCGLEQECIDSDFQCLDGCYCPEGLIHENGTCLNPTECPCMFQGIPYIPGSVIQEQCSNCICGGGIWNCTENNCPAECSVTGDIHFKTFDERVYTFHATCQYILAKSRNSGKFTISLQNSQCGTNLNGVCIQSVSLVVDEDLKKQVTLTHSGEVYHCNQYRISLPYTDDLFEVTELSSVFVQVKTNFGLSLQYDREGRRLYIQVGARWKEDTVGLCGTFNGNIQDDFLLFCFKSPGGMIESTPQLFANSWRISTACNPGANIPEVDPCDTHQQSASYATEKCSIISGYLFAACHQYLSPELYQQQCKTDTCKCGETCMCSAVAHYARQCRSYGIFIDIRSNVSECAIQCPDTMEYGTCVSFCNQKCQSISTPEDCSGECAEGCNCPVGTYYNTRTHTCVKKNDCPCYFMGAEYTPGEVTVSSSGMCEGNIHRTYFGHLIPYAGLKLTVYSLLLAWWEVHSFCFAELGIYSFFLGASTDFIVAVPASNEKFIGLDFAVVMKVKLSAFSTIVPLKLTATSGVHRCAGECKNPVVAVSDSHFSRGCTVEVTADWNQWEIFELEMSSTLNNASWSCQPFRGSAAPRGGVATTVTALGLGTRPSTRALTSGFALKVSCNCRVKNLNEICNIVTARLQEFNLQQKYWEATPLCKLYFNGNYKNVAEVNIVKIIHDTQCGPGQIYFNCSAPASASETSVGAGCRDTCENLLLNISCPESMPCLSGCVCPSGLVKHEDECFKPNECPCLWKGKEYFPGDLVRSPCYTCVCQQGTFQCTFQPCPSMCTAYGDRHYKTFDGVLYDFISACKVYLVKSLGTLSLSIITENIDCYGSGTICRKALSVSVGHTFLVFDDDSGNTSPSSVIDVHQIVHIWKAGIFTVIHFPAEEITILWDQRTTTHVQVGPKWQGKLSGLCGNFDMKTANEMRTPDHMESPNPQEFGNSWTAVECANSPDIRNPCNVNPFRESFAKKECGILLSEVFEPCHPVVDVTWFYSNCLTDTCACNRGGDCECFCTSVLAYAHMCCQHGIAIDWRTPAICPSDCEYYNKVLGKGPYSLVSDLDGSNAVVAANLSSGVVFPATREISTPGVLTLFMLTPGLYSPKPQDISLVSLEVADKPNYFLRTRFDGALHLNKWEYNKTFQKEATFIFHKDAWVLGYNAFESYIRPGFFIHHMGSSIHLMRYNHSKSFRHATLFQLAGSNYLQKDADVEWNDEKNSSCYMEETHMPLGFNQWRGQVSPAHGEGALQSVVHGGPPPAKPTTPWTPLPLEFTCTPLTEAFWSGPPAPGFPALGLGPRPLQYQQWPPLPVALLILLTCRLCDWLAALGSGISIFKGTEIPEPKMSLPEQWRIAPGEGSKRQRQGSPCLFGLAPGAPLQLKFCIQVWAPHFRKDVKALEMVQTRFTGMLVFYPWWPDGKGTRKQPDAKILSPVHSTCEWQYETCTSPCIRTCRDPTGRICQSLPRSYFTLVLKQFIMQRMHTCNYFKVMQSLEPVEIVLEILVCHQAVQTQTSIVLYLKSPPKTRTASLSEEYGTEHRAVISKLLRFRPYDEGKLINEAAEDGLLDTTLVKCCLDVKGSNSHHASGIQLFCPCLDQSCNVVWSQVTPAELKLCIGHSWAIFHIYGYMSMFQLYLNSLARGMVCLMLLLACSPTLLIKPGLVPWFDDSMLTVYHCATTSMEESGDVGYKGMICVEGCVPHCPLTLVFDEDTQRCVYPEDCIIFPPESALNAKVLVNGIGGEYILISLHWMHLECDLMSRMVTVGVVHSLPVDGVDLLLQYDLAVAKVTVSPGVTERPSEAKETEQSQEKVPGIFPSCVVNRAVAKQDTLSEVKLAPQIDSRLSETFFGNLDNPKERFSQSSLITAQQANPELNEVGKSALTEAEAKGVPEGYYIKNGILMRKWRPPHRPTDKEWVVVHLIVVPLKYHREILRIAHEIPMPKQEIMRFCGMCGFYRKVVPNFSTIVVPPMELLQKKKAKVVWSGECQAAFERMKVILIDEPMLAAPNFTKPSHKNIRNRSRSIRPAIYIQPSKPTSSPASPGISTSPAFNVSVKPLPLSTTAAFSQYTSSPIAASSARITASIPTMEIPLVTHLSTSPITSLTGTTTFVQKITSATPSTMEQASVSYFTKSNTSPASALVVSSEKAVTTSATALPEWSTLAETTSTTELPTEPHFLSTSVETKPTITTTMPSTITTGISLSTAPETGSRWLTTTKTISSKTEPLPEKISSTTVAYPSVETKSMAQKASVLPTSKVTTEYLTSKEIASTTLPTFIKTTTKTTSSSYPVSTMYHFSAGTVSSTTEKTKSSMSAMYPLSTGVFKTSPTLHPSTEKLTTASSAILVPITERKTAITTQPISTERTTIYPMSSRTFSTTIPHTAYPALTTLYTASKEATPTSTTTVSLTSSATMSSETPVKTSVHGTYPLPTKTITSFSVHSYPSLSTKGPETSSTVKIFKTVSTPQTTVMTSSSIIEPYVTSKLTSLQPTTALKSTFSTSTTAQSTTLLATSSLQTTKSPTTAIPPSIKMSPISVSTSKTTTAATIIQLGTTTVLPTLLKTNITSVTPQTTIVSELTSKMTAVPHTTNATTSVTSLSTTSTTPTSIRSITEKVTSTMVEVGVTGPTAVLSATPLTTETSTTAVNETSVTGLFVATSEGVKTTAPVTPTTISIGTESVTGKTVPPQQLKSTTTPVSESLNRTVSIERKETSVKPVPSTTQPSTTTTLESLPETLHTLSDVSLSTIIAPRTSESVAGPTVFSATAYTTALTISPTSQCIVSERSKNSLFPPTPVTLLKPYVILTISSFLAPTASSSLWTSNLSTRPIPNQDGLRAVCFILEQRPNQSPSTTTLLRLAEFVLISDNISFNATHFLQIPFTQDLDECIKQICVEGKIMQINRSHHCPYIVSPPSCELLGFAVQVNGDKCCPQWECPCRCSILANLHIITFDGSGFGISGAASYVIASLANETIIVGISECLGSQMVMNSSFLCLTKLNITHGSNYIIIDRQLRRLSINSRFGYTPFRRFDFEIIDTGSMYTILTPAGINIQWFHSTGIMVIDTGTPNKKLATMGLCGYCDGNPINDLALKNGTVLKKDDDPVTFIQDWTVASTESGTKMIRRLEVNCSTSNCSECFRMLQSETFTLCHAQVSPEMFCELWIRDSLFVNNHCSALAAYVALCNKFNICLEWRKPDYCSFTCPANMIYQACVLTCEAKTCQNRIFFPSEDASCSILSEGCVCPQGTILHRLDSTLCIPEEKCACTDTWGLPHAAGETWNASLDGCCRYQCLENGTIITVDHNCSAVPEPICHRSGEVVVSLASDKSCCPNKICACNQTVCESFAPQCSYGERLITHYKPDFCCSDYFCECDPGKCESDIPICREDQTLIATHADGSCCLAYICMCGACADKIPTCQEGEVLTVDNNTTEMCCPAYQCVCEISRCPKFQCHSGMKAVQAWSPDQCCPFHSCECACDTVLKPQCKLGEVLVIEQQHGNIKTNPCGCPEYQCVNEQVCIDGERGILRPGQTIVEHTANGLCYTTHCTYNQDNKTGFYQLLLRMVNCSAQCEMNQVYIPPTDLTTCCGLCKNVSCLDNLENETTTMHKPGTSWMSNCVRHDCTDTVSGPVLITSNISCPPFNETACLKIGGSVITYMDGCCKSCKEDVKSCQKVVVRMTIRKNDCRSNRPVNIVSCDGKCPSASIYNYSINTHARFCKCCREIGLQKRTVQLYCSSNSTWVNYSIQEPTDCSCQWS